MIGRGGASYWLLTCRFHRSLFCVKILGLQNLADTNGLVWLEFCEAWGGRVWSAWEGRQFSEFGLWHWEAIELLLRWGRDYWERVGERLEKIKKKKKNSTVESPPLPRGLCLQVAGDHRQPPGLVSFLCPHLRGNFPAAGWSYMSPSSICSYVCVAPVMWKWNPQLGHWISSLHYSTHFSSPKSIFLPPLDHLHIIQTLLPFLSFSKSFSWPCSPTPSSICFPCKTPWKSSPPPTLSWFSLSLRTSFSEV